MKIKIELSDRPEDWTAQNTREVVDLILKEKEAHLYPFDVWERRARPFKSLKSYAEYKGSPRRVIPHVARLIERAGRISDGSRYRKSVFQVRAEGGFLVIVLETNDYTGD